ncbi:glycosyl hydrolase family 57 [mine drainage metagenome]|uniref:Glycosyl hydrolase family 57 n=1 Tax=mine drainage metagenome TaxID=410659 RepID=A0A1J5Q8B5_9ZZZZ
MSHPRKLYVNFYWHMHQPDYRDYMTGEYVLPWTYLHAIKDYTDMAYHLEQNPKAKATFNFVPVLLDQLEDYADQFATHNMRDPLLALFLVEADALTAEQRKLIIDSCFKSNHSKMIEPFPRYRHLHEMFKLSETYGEESLDYLSGQYLMDLLVWYHLAWTGESVRREEELVARLMAKGGQFSMNDRLDMFALMGQLVTGIIPRYKALQAAGQIELSSTPHYHPILPLLLDFNSARDSMPDVVLPESPRYPGGLQRARAHIISAVETHYRRFGQPPRGMWPAEGSVSHPALMLLAEQGMRWAASGEGVLANSLRLAYGDSALPERQHYLYKPYRVTDGRNGLVTFFRDDKLSDKIGFEYSKWHGADAVSDFVRELEHIWHITDPDETPVVSIILDGENAWEYFPYNAYYFLTDLYQALAGHHHIELSTFSEVVSHCSPVADDEELLEVESFHGANIVLENLPAICAGSWVYGNFSTWIGSTDKNRGWDLLCEAKKNYDLAMSSKRLNAAEKALAERQLGDCEGSDWFWWFGDYNSGVSVQSFDRLYRRNLTNLYRLLHLPVPKILEKVISIGGGDPEGGGTMRRGEA